MKVVILAGGLGTRLSEETASRPKPMVEIGERPILWHIMKSYSHYGFNDFVVCLGYKGYVIKEYFSNYFLHMSDVTFDMRDNSMAGPPERRRAVAGDARRHGPGDADRRPAQAGRRYIGDETFMLTYGDGVADVDIAKLVEFHRAHGKLATITAVQPLGRFGSLEIEDDEVVGGVVAPASARSRRSRVGDGAWVNGGFFVLEPARPRPHRRATRRCSRARRSRASPPMASWWPTDTRVLAADGRAARSPHPAGALGLGRRAVGCMDARIRRRRIRGCRITLLRRTRAARSSSPAIPDSRARGSPSGSRTLGAQVTGLRAGSAHRAEPVRRARPRRSRIHACRRRRP